MNADDFGRAIERATSRLRTRVLSMVGRMIVASTDDTTTIQSLKVKLLDGEVLEGIPHMQPGGLVHRPVPGAEGVFLSVTGDRDNGVAVCVSRRSTRPNGLNAGETALYSDSTGEGYTGGVRILLDQYGGVVVSPFAGQRMIVEGDATITGALLVEGILQVEGAIRGEDEVTANYGGASVGLSTHPHPAPMGPTLPANGGT